MRRAAGRRIAGCTPKDATRSPRVPELAPSRVVGPSVRGVSIFEESKDGDGRSRRAARVVRVLAGTKLFRDENFYMFCLPMRPEGV